MTECCEEVKTFSAIFASILLVKIQYFVTTTCIIEVLKYLSITSKSRFHFLFLWKDYTLNLHYV